MTDLASRIEAAAERLEGRVRRTPCVAESALEVEGCVPWLKLESEQETGSFKLRGATHRLLTLEAAQRGAGVVTASSGNHGLAVATAATRLGISSRVYLPESVSPAKLERLRTLGVDTVLVPGDPLEAEKRARRRAEREGRVYVSPYNDLDVVAGQATVGVELLEQLPKLDVVYVTVGGGGLIGGIGAWLRSRRPGTRIVGCLPAHSAVMYESVRAGRIVDRPSRPTLSDGSAGGLEEGSLTFGLCRAVVDEWHLVEEAEIARVMALTLRSRRCAVEGAAAVAIAGWLERGPARAGETAAIVVCGRNVSLSTLKRVLRNDAQAGDHSDSMPAASLT